MLKIFVYFLIDVKQVLGGGGEEDIVFSNKRFPVLKNRQAN